MTTQYGESASTSRAVTFDIVVRKTLDETRTQKKLKDRMAELHRQEEENPTKISSDPDNDDDVFYPMLLHAKDELPRTTQPYVRPNEPWPHILMPIVLLVAGSLFFYYGYNCTVVYFTEESFQIVTVGHEDDPRYGSYIFGPPTLAFGMVLLTLGACMLEMFANWKELIFSNITIYLMRKSAPS